MVLPNQISREQVNSMASSQVHTKSEHSQVPLLDRSVPFMEGIVVTKKGVTKLLKGLNPSKALGPGELHSRVLKESAIVMPSICPSFPTMD